MKNKKRIVVFGATSAIATESLKKFVAKGYDCCLVARDAEKLAILSDDLSVRSTVNIVSIEADLSVADSHSSLFANIKSEFGDFDTVLIAYGTLSEQQQCQLDYDTTLRELNINFLSVISLLTIIANIFEGQGLGQIAVISSVAGDRGRQSNYIYGAAKGGLSIYLQGLRNRLAKHNINVITIKPGFVDTPMTRDFKKGILWVSPEKIANGIFVAMNKRRDVVYLPWFWQWIMLIIKLIPERVFKKLSL